MSAARKIKEPLSDRIRLTCAEAETFIDAMAAELKASADGRSQPLVALRVMLTRHDDCGVALRLMGENQ